MAYSNIDSLAMGSLLQILFSNGVRVQISEDFRDFEMIKRAKVGSSVPREFRFELQTSLGPSAVSSRNPGTTNRAFPSAQQVSLAEYTAKFKEIQATLELEYNVWDRAMKSPEKYGDPLAIEVQAKASATKRYLAKRLYGDGTGVEGQLGASSAAVTSPASDKLTFTLSSSNTARGHVGNFEYDDILLLKSSAGGTSTLDTSLATEPAYWKVIDKDRENNTVTLQGLDSSFASAGTITSITTQPTSGDVFYRYQQPTIPDLTASISDYGTLTEEMAGLESLAAADGRVIHGMTMSGALGASRIDAGANPIDVKYIEKVMNKAKLRVGQDRYKYKMMIMAPETQSSFIESRETDRRFQTVEDNKRGVKYFAYVHRQDTLECVDTEYCPMKRLYVLPEAKTGEKVLEFHGSDFEAVKTPKGDDWHVKVSGGAYVGNMQQFLNAIGVIVAKHPAAIAVVENFTNS